MEREIKNRRKRVFVCMLIAALLWNHVPAMLIQAADYNNIENSESAIQQGIILTPGVDTISWQQLADIETQSLSIAYYADGTESSGNPFQTVELKSGDTSTSHTVLNYDAVQPYVKFQAENLIGWKTNYVSSTGGVVVAVELIPVLQYAIQYELNSGTNDASNPSTYVVGEGVKSFAPASKSGYTFKGWYDESLSKEITYISGDSAEDVTLYAQWEANPSYNITYELNGGTLDGENPSSYTEGVGVSSFVSPNKTGYNFVGWYDAETGGNRIESIGSDQKGEITLYAQYDPAAYTITYVLDGGEHVEKNPEEYTYGMGVEKFEDAKKDGHTFVGWYDAETGGNLVKSIGAEQTDPVTLYARYEVNSYEIIYVLDGGENAETNPGSYTYGIGVERLEDAYKEGYTFMGWYLDADHTMQMTGIPTTQIDPVILYARYELATYTITYELDGGKNVETNPGSYTYGMGVEKFEDAKKDGHTFVGWYADADYTMEITNIPADQTGPVTLYALYEAETYNITYDLDGGEHIGTNPEEYTYGVGVERFKAAYKEGYTFAGWYEDADFTIEITGIPADKTGDIILYAKYTVIEDEPDGDIPPTDAPEEEEPGTEVPTLIERGGVMSLKTGVAYTLSSGSWKVTGDTTVYAGGVTFYVSTEADYELIMQ